MSVGAAPRVEAADLIGGRTCPIPGEVVRSHNPARPDEVVWAGAPSVAHADDAVRAAREALPAWRGAPVEARVAVLRAYREIAAGRVDEVAALIARETGKPLWDSKSEAALLAGKVDTTIEPADAGPHAARRRTTGFEIAVTPTRRGVCSFRPHGVMAVVGPFNFPAHLPNGHIVPALLAGNTVVFKPSDKAPAVGQLLASMLLEAALKSGAPAGIVNLVHGGAHVASRLTTHDGVDGVLFTGSWPVGRRILEANLDRPGRIVALELGGNNPAVVLDDADLKQAAIECARASFVSTGQRCTCTRRIIVQRGIAGKFIPLLQRIASTMVVGDPVEGVAGQPAFMGPIIRAEARDAVLAFQRDAARAGGRVLLEASAKPSETNGHYLTPGILEVDRFTLTDAGPGRDAGCDVEVFGPLVRIAVVDSIDEAIDQANATRYGLASAVFTRDARASARFLAESRAGCVNVNTGTAGASGKLPFGGLGLSGNHRPAGSFSLDYCAYPVASLVETSDEAGLLPGMGFDAGWVR